MQLIQPPLRSLEGPTTPSSLRRHAPCPPHSGALCAAPPPSRCSPPSREAASPLPCRARAEPPRDLPALRGLSDRCCLRAGAPGQGHRGAGGASEASSSRRGFRGSLAVAAAAAASGAQQFATDREKEDWMKRQRESGGGSAAPAGGDWRWTLNWSPIVPGILVGSCPRSPGDIDRIADEAGATALVNLQSDVCFEALQIPFESIRDRAVERGVCLERVPVRDFDHGDQAFMLPQAVRMLSMLLARGHIVYVHCTAGINRASLTVLGYLTFVQGMDLEPALQLLKSARPIVHPYLDCWHTVRGRLLSGRNEELMAVAAEVYAKRCREGAHGNSASDWKQAQSTVISRQFDQYLTIDLNKLEGEESLWSWQVQEQEQELARQASAQAASEVEAQQLLQQLEEDSRRSEQELNQLSIRALTKQLQSLALKSRVLRLETQAGLALGESPTGCEPEEGSIEPADDSAASEPVPV